MTASRVEGVVDRATHSDAFQFGARAGFAISGVLHLLVGYIIARIVFGSGAPPTSRARWPRWPKAAVARWCSG